MIKTYAVIGAFLLSFIMGAAYAEGLPGLPPKDKKNELSLSREDLLPEKTPPKKDELGEDHNAKEKKQVALDKQFAALKRAADVNEAAKISSRIQGLWEQSGSDTIDLLMQWAQDAIRDNDYVRAMDFLDNVVALQPDYAEGWMRRAAVHAQTDNLALSMFDLSHVLELEPRHYNALALVGMIMEATERDERAIKAYGQALDIYPQMSRVQQRLGDLLEKGTDKVL